MTVKLWIVIVCHISTKNHQLDFPNFHFSIVRSYCSYVFDHKKWVKISNASYENEIQSKWPFQQGIQKDNFCQGGPNFWGRDGQKI